MDAKLKEQLEQAGFVVADIQGSATSSAGRGAQLRNDPLHPIITDQALLERMEAEGLTQCRSTGYVLNNSMFSKGRSNCKPVDSLASRISGLRKRGEAFDPATDPYIASVDESIRAGVAHVFKAFPADPEQAKAYAESKAAEAAGETNGDEEQHEE